APRRARDCESQHARFRSLVHTERVVDVYERLKRGCWYALAVVASVLAAGGVLDAVWRFRQADPWVLLSMPLGLLFWYWIGIGAWRRARSAALTTSSLEQCP
ncbi:MAG TPA: hypothetical protein VGR26_00115, partial [Acidimicrobiales bacterium]|nr:hypothetical protein [Acidimicrobiales bacterium]